MIAETNAPNHHAHHPGFAGVSGLLAALTMTVGRGADADLVAGLAALGPTDRVVDVGCGPGVAVRRAAREATSVVGVDPSAMMLRVARILAATASNARVRRGVAESLPLEDRSATVVWSIATAHHWQDVDAGLTEARRVLEPGGRLVVVERRSHEGATGLASHGWTEPQAEAFAARCRANGFTDVSVGEHMRARRGPVLAVTGRVPATAT